MCGAWYGLFARIAYQTVDAVALDGVLCTVLLFGLQGLLLNLCLGVIAAL